MTKSEKWRILKQPLAVISLLWLALLVLSFNHGMVMILWSFIEMCTSLLTKCQRTLLDYFCGRNKLILMYITSSLWVSRTGSTSDWCALQEVLYKCISTIQLHDILWLQLVFFLPVGHMTPGTATNTLRIPVPSSTSTPGPAKTQGTWTFLFSCKGSQKFFHNLQWFLNVRWSSRQRLRSGQFNCSFQYSQQYGW